MFQSDWHALNQSLDIADSLKAVGRIIDLNSSFDYAIISLTTLKVTRGLKHSTFIYIIHESSQPLLRLEFAIRFVLCWRATAMQQMDQIYGM